MKRHPEPSPGQKFGRLFVIRQLPAVRGKSHIKVLCLCTCGKEITASRAKLYSSHTRSCGCLARDKTIARSYKHGASRRDKETPEHITWQGIRARCRRTNHQDYADYGGRGITVDPRWDDFVNFFSDMGIRPSPKHSIERVDNNLGYSKENCVWALPEQQANNKRKTVFVCWNDHVMSISQACKYHHINRRTVLRRIRKLKWSISRALTTPTARVRKLLKQP